jgi:hypothetical protein
MGIFLAQGLIIPECIFDVGVLSGKGEVQIVGILEICKF